MFHSTKEREIVVTDVRIKCRWIVRSKLNEPMLVGFGRQLCKPINVSLCSGKIIDAVPCETGGCRGSFGRCAQLTCVEIVCSPTGKSVAVLFHSSRSNSGLWRGGYYESIGKVWSLHP